MYASLAYLWCGLAAPNRYGHNNNVVVDLYDRFTSGFDLAKIK